MSKSNSVLRTNCAYSRRYSESAVRNDSTVKNARFDTNYSSKSTDISRNQLCRTQSDEAKHRGYKSVDVVNAFDNTTTSGIVHEDSQIDETLKGMVEPHSAVQSTYSLLLKEVPERRSSLAISRQPSLQDFPSWKLPPATAAGRLIPSRGRAESPVKMSSTKDAVSSDTWCCSPSYTFIRSVPPTKLIKHGKMSHHRVELYTKLKGLLFIGGGTVEGDIKLAIDQNERRKNKSRPVLISKLSVDVIGVEETSDSRK